MAHITKSYNFTNPALYDGTALEAALSAFLALVNGKIDATNMDRGSTAVFDWLNTRLKNLSDPVDLQDAVTLNYITNVITALHTHSNKAILDAILDAGSGSIITAAERAKLAAILDTGDGNIPSSAERARFLTQDQSDAMNAANAPGSSNPIATMSDIPGAISGMLVWKGMSVISVNTSRTVYPDGTNAVRIKFYNVYTPYSNLLQFSEAEILIKNNPNPLVASTWQGFQNVINLATLPSQLGASLFPGYYNAVISNGASSAITHFPEANMTDAGETGAYLLALPVTGYNISIKPSAREIWTSMAVKNIADFYFMS